MMDKNAGSSSQQESDPHFFRTIGHQTLEAGNLEIPDTFVNKYGSYLSKYACLEINSGKIWKVELEKCDGQVRLHKGWREFVDTCNIKCGYSLAFRYEGGSFFHVFVFDSTHLEIDYSASTNQRVDLDQPEISNIKVEDFSGDSSLVILDDWPQKANEVLPVNLSSDDEVLQGEKEPSPPSARDGVVPNPTQTGISVATALEKAKCLQCNKPSFVVAIKTLYQLCIPAHALGYLLDQHEKYVFFHGLDGRTWSVKCYVYGKVGRFSAGWKDFVRGNYLQNGDACVFELLSQAPNCYNVTIFRAAESATPN